MGVRGEYIRQHGIDLIFLLFLLPWGEEDLRLRQGAAALHPSY